jgi:hypothetical protein
MVAGIKIAKPVGRCLDDTKYSPDDRVHDAAIHTCEVEMSAGLSETFSCSLLGESVFNRLARLYCR